ncbi:hypothetical protein DYGSA30_32040 [Dyella sp. GSA-30]|nr:hypothetical protein DYGSA30_32040 [Dyella sp. GSA-30]
MVAYFMREDFQRVVGQVQPRNFFKVDHHALVDQPNHGEATGQPFLRSFGLRTTQPWILQPRKATPRGKRRRPRVTPWRQDIVDG